MTLKEKDYTNDEGLKDKSLLLDESRRSLTSEEMDNHMRFLVNYSLEHHIAFRVTKKHGCTVEVLNND